MAAWQKCKAQIAFVRFKREFGSFWIDFLGGSFPG
jgi:hypothetical protein